MKKFFIFYLFFVINILTSCSAPESLSPFNEIQDEHLNIEGIWHFSGKYNESIKLLNKSLSQFMGDRLTNGNIYSTSKNRSINKFSKYNAHLFIRNAEIIKITHNKFSLFIDFNRSIVEEYNHNRVEKINIGEASAFRSSGWKGITYHIETLDRNGLKVTELFSLSDNGNSLNRKIIYRNEKQEEFVITQSFLKKT
tara:strand:- start:1256 stop:1843 length:588 start_codon:yes stop_codon:yes gene_type:complete